MDEYINEISPIFWNPATFDEIAGCNNLVKHAISNNKDVAFILKFLYINMIAASIAAKIIYSLGIVDVAVERNIVLGYAKRTLGWEQTAEFYVRVDWNGVHTPRHRGGHVDMFKNKFQCSNISLELDPNNCGHDIDYCRMLDDYLRGIFFTEKMVNGQKMMVFDRRNPNFRNLDRCCAAITKSS